MIRGGADLPLVPLVVNTAGPPLPSMQRCVALGRSLGTAIRAADAGRVLLIASGGLSHWLPPNDPRDTSVPAERRAAMIHGRRDVRAFSATREPLVRALGGNPDARVNAAWDSWFLKQLVAADLDPVTNLGDEELAERRAAAATRSAPGSPALPRQAGRWCGPAIDPVPEWITGMGIGTTLRWPDVTHGTLPGLCGHRGTGTARRRPYHGRPCSPADLTQRLPRRWRRGRRWSQLTDVAGSCPHDDASLQPHDQVANINVGEGAHSGECQSKAVVPASPRRVEQARVEESRAVIASAVPGRVTGVPLRELGERLSGEESGCP